MGDTSIWDISLTVMVFSKKKNTEDYLILKLFNCPENYCALKECTEIEN